MMKKYPVSPLLAWVWIAAFAVMTTSTLPLHAQTQSGLSFLKIGVGARATGMASAYTALANDVTSIYWNPAGLASVRRNELSAMHSEWLAGSNFDFLGFGRPWKAGSVALGVSALTHPTFEARDETGRKVGSFDARDTAFTLAYGQRLMPGLQTGVGFKLIQSQIGQDRGQGYAFDLGMSWNSAQRPVSLGASVLNLGPGIRYIGETTRLPLTFSLGAAWHAIAGLSLAADARRLVYDGRTTLSIGTEYMLLPMFTVRGGYLLSSATSLQQANALGMGFGLKLMGQKVDYAFTPFGELGATQRISLNWRF